MGCGNVQVCTAAMAYGFHIVGEMIAGLQLRMEDKGYERLSDCQGRAVPNVTDWQHLNLNYTAKARIDQHVCVQCGRCYAACEDTSHQSIAIREGRVFEVIEAECVACNLCVITCPVQDCITMESLGGGAIDPRTGKEVEGYANWTTHPNNPERGGRAAGVVRRTWITQVQALQSVPGAVADPCGTLRPRIPGAPSPLWCGWAAPAAYRARGPLRSPVPPSSVAASRPYCRHSRNQSEFWSLPTET